MSTSNISLNYNNIKGKKGVVLAFICNHCPYVKDIISRIIKDFTYLKKLDVGVAAIMPNDTVNYPEDSFINMQKFAIAHKFNFPYLIDETQKVAREYRAVCTPDFFCFNKEDKLFYRGRLDNLKYMEKNQSNRKPELVIAFEEMIRNENIVDNQINSMGCSIKWKKKIQYIFDANLKFKATINETILDYALKVKILLPYSHKSRACRSYIALFKEEKATYKNKLFTESSG